MKPIPYSPHDMIPADAVPPDADPLLEHQPTAPRLPAPPWLEALRSTPADTPVPATSPADLCRACTHLLRTDTSLQGECRKVALTTTRWGVLAGAPGNEVATRWQARADQEAQEAAAYRAGERPDCPPRQMRVGVVL